MLPAPNFTWNREVFRLREPVSLTWGMLDGLSFLICVFPGKYNFKCQSNYASFHTLYLCQIEKHIFISPNHWRKK